MRVVLDTNVLVSAIVFGGAPRQILESGIAGSIRLCVSESLIRELQAVLRRAKFGFTAQMVQTVVSELTAVSDWVVPEKHHDLIAADPADNEVLDCAVAAEADYIVTGDSHLLRLGKCGEVGIVTPEAFIRVSPKQ